MFDCSEGKSNNPHVMKSSHSMPLYGGVDGGGSGSRFVVLDERGTVVAESHGDTTNQWVIILRLDFLNVLKQGSWISHISTVSVLCFF